MKRKRTKPEPPPDPQIEYEDAEPIATELDSVNRELVACICRFGELLVQQYREDLEGNGKPRFARWCRDRLGLNHKSAALLMRTYLLFAEDSTIINDSMTVSHGTLLALSDPQVRPGIIETFRAIIRGGGSVNEDQAIAMAQESQDKSLIAWELIRFLWSEMNFKDKSKFLTDMRDRAMREDERLAVCITPNEKSIRQLYREKREERNNWAQWRRRVKEKSNSLPAMFGKPRENRPIHRP